METANKTAIQIEAEAPVMEPQRQFYFMDLAKKLVEERNEARKNKNWVESDRIRDILMSKGYTVKDGKEGTIIEK